MTKKDNVKGDHNVFQAGSMMVKFVQNNYNRVKGGWVPADEDDFVEYEEVDAIKTAQKAGAEDPNFFQTGRFLKAVICEDWFEDVRTHERYTKKWRNTFVEDLLNSKYGWDIAVAWEDKDKREPLKGYVVGCLKDAGVISGSYDGIAKLMGYDNDSYRSFSRNLGRGKEQPYIQWVKNYVEESKLEE